MTLSNPYPQKGRRRIYTDISDLDFYLLRSCRPEHGTICNTIAILVNKLCNELRKRNIQDFTKLAEFEQFVATCVITNRDDGGRLHDVSTIGPLHQEAIPSNVGRGEETGSDKSAQPPSELSVVPSGGRKRGKGRSKGKEG